MISKIQELMSTWGSDLKMISYTHYKTVVRLAHWNHQLRIAIGTVSAVVGSAIFDTLKQNPEARLRKLTSFLTVVVDNSGGRRLCIP
jgi:hypothetical protein